MKKILFCIHRQSPFYHTIPLGLNKLGYKVNIFDYYQSNYQIRLLGLMNNLLHFDHKRKIINKQINLSLINTVKKIKPDYLFMIKGLNIENETINNIRKMQVVTINWFQDLLEFMPWLKQHAYCYDYLFTPDPLMKRELGKLKIKSYYLPLAAVPDEKFSSTRKKYGVVFSGQCTKRRLKLFKQLTTLGNDFTIWGYPGWKNTFLAKHYQGFLPTLENMLQKFRESKIVINIQTAEDNYPSDVVSLRAFEATGVGTFLLNWKHKYIDDFWQEGKEIVNFKNQQDLLTKAKYYLTHEVQRENIALAGWKRTVKEHTYDKRLKDMFKIILNNT